MNKIAFWVFFFFFKSEIVFWASFPCIFCNRRKWSCSITSVLYFVFWVLCFKPTDWEKLACPIVYKIVESNSYILIAFASNKHSEMSVIGLPAHPWSPIKIVPSVNFKFWAEICWAGLGWTSLFLRPDLGWDYSLGNGRILGLQSGLIMGQIGPLEIWWANMLSWTELCSSLDG